MSKSKMTKKELEAFGFEKIGEWQFCPVRTNGKPKYGSVKHLSNMKGIEFLIPEEHKKEGDVVYAFLAGDEVIYVGETTRGMNDRFSGYRYGNPKESDTDNNVKKEITKTLTSGIDISIWCIKPVAILRLPDREPMEIPASKPFEEHIIAKFHLRANKKDINAKK